MKRIIVFALAIGLIVGCKSKKEVAQKAPEKMEAKKTEVKATAKQETNATEKEMPKKVGNTQIVMEKDAPQKPEPNEPQRPKPVEGMAEDPGGAAGPAHKGEEPRLLLLDKKNPAQVSEMADDFYNINNVSIYQFQIIVELNYSGGCTGVNFQAVWNGVLMKSMPPKANVSLLLDDKDDCEALVSERVYIDIAPLLKEVGDQGVWVRLKGWDTPLDFTVKQ